MFTLSVCMIVKNESKCLGRILSCVKEFADEIIIVDTGSSDNTKEIAHTYTNHVFDFKWIDDFAAARNFAFSKATCDYQMWLDADDIITEDNIDKIKKLKASDSNADVFMCKYITGANGELVFYRERIVKRSANFKWKGIVHEVITPRGKIEYLDIEITHKQGEHDPNRNLKIYQNAINKGVKLNPREQYYYARELYYTNQIKDAINAFLTFLEMPSYPPDNLSAHIVLSDCYLIQEDTNNAINILFEAIKKHTPTAELCCKIGHVFDVMKLTNQAIFWYTSSLICAPQTQGFVYKDYYDMIPYLELTKLHYNSGNFEEAKKFHLLAKNTNPNHPSVLFNEQFFQE